MRAGEGIDFVRGYADRFHHAKEEDILFDYADKFQQVDMAADRKELERRLKFVRGVVARAEKLKGGGL